VVCAGRERRGAGALGAASQRPGERVVTEVGHDRFDQPDRVGRVVGTRTVGDRPARRRP
jgi:hypothetical protein